MLILLLLCANVEVGRRAFITVKVQDYGEIGHVELDLTLTLIVGDM